MTNISKKSGEKRLSVALPAADLRRIKIKSAKVGQTYAEITRTLWARFLAGEIKI